MSIGLEIYNDSSILQISSNTPNFVFTQKIIFNNTSNFTFQVNGNNPVCFIQGTSGCLISAKIRQGNLHTFQILNPQYAYTNVTIYVFDRVINPTHNIGFEVYASDGTSCYSADNKPLRITSLFNIPNWQSDGSTNNLNFSMPSGSWAAFIPSPRYKTIRVGAVNYTVSDIIRTSANNINLSWERLDDAIDGAYGVYNNGGQLLIADVAGL